MPDSSQPDDLKTFKSTITDADDLGAIIVAAAGNDSPRKINGRTVDPMPMQVPAEYPNVIGVAATNKDGKRSCYSNAGDVSAPGGDGSPGKNGDGSTNPCVSRADSWDKPPGPNGGSECTDIANCPYILISLAQTENGPQYIYWSGTSFATPLFSGLAALAYEEGEKSQVECLIRRGASPLVGATTSDPNNWGIINITESLSNAVLSACGVSP
jgi:subtilisin family serine protease